MGSCHSTIFRKGPIPSSPSHADADFQYTANHKGMEQLIIEFDAKIDILEREIQELKVTLAIFQLESLPLSEQQKNINGVLEIEIRDLKAAMSTLETNHPQSDRVLKKEVDRLAVRAMSLELDFFMSRTQLGDDACEPSALDLLAGLHFSSSSAS